VVAAAAPEQGKEHSMELPRKRIINGAEKEKKNNLAERKGKAPVFASYLAITAESLARE
jgi:hypothetical protein